MRETEGGWGGGGRKQSSYCGLAMFLLTRTGARVPEPEYEMQRTHEELDDIESLTLCVCVCLYVLLIL